MGWHCFYFPIPRIYSRTLYLGTLSCCLICRKHFLQCEQGLLIKHFEKLIQCDERLQCLSQQPDVTLDSRHSDFAFDKYDNLKKYDLDQINDKGSVTSRFPNTGSPNSSLSPSFTLDNNPFEGASSSSGTNKLALILIGFNIGPIILLNYKNFE